MQSIQLLISLNLGSFFFLDKPHCTIERQDVKDEDTLICSAKANPQMVIVCQIIYI